MTVRLVIGIGVVRFQIEIVKLLEHRVGRRGRGLEGVDFSGVGKERAIRRMQDAAGGDRTLILSGKQKGIATVAEDDIRSFELELGGTPHG